MTLCRLIAPKWMVGHKPKEGMFTDAQLEAYNTQGYNIYYLPNGPKEYTRDMSPIDGTHIDDFKWIFVDCDLKDGVWASKDEFIDALAHFKMTPNRIVDSGNGIHAYWQVSDLDAMSYLRFQRRLTRLFKTDETIATLFQLMRLPGYVNTKNQDNMVMCEIRFECEGSDTCETYDKLLPPITLEDEAYCQQHYDRTFNINQDQTEISDALPPKFGKLLSTNNEAKELFSGAADDRSKSDFRLGHLMFANGFTRDEALSVLINTAKASQRAPVHRKNYALNITDKIWTYELTQDKETVNLSPTVRDILARGEDTVNGIRFSCNKLVDDTIHGFRLGQVIGIIGGSGVGKTTLTLNMFLWFCINNPEYHHFFFSLEQPAGEIASRIRAICGDNDSLYDHIHIVSNYAEDGTFNNFSIQSVEDHLLKFQVDTKLKVGATVIDHIGVLDKQTKNGENDGLIGICRKMKALAVKVNTMLIMLSQAPREKSGVGDLELDKSAAYGTVFFEAFVDYCICLWQPLKRAYSKGAPTVMAFKFAKIRHKKQGQDRIQEDTCYQLFFDPKTERLRELTQDEEISAKYFVGIATNMRKLDKKTDIVPYNSRRVGEDTNAKEAGPSTGTPVLPTNSRIQNTR